MSKQYDNDDIFGLAKANTESISALIDVAKSNRLMIQEARGEIKELRTDFDNYKTLQEEKEQIDPAQADELEQAIHMRVGELLGPYGDEVFHAHFGAFCKRLWLDAKKARLIIGKKGVYTLKKYFEPAKDYINKWTPYKRGVEGYIEYLNNRHEILEG